MPLPKTILVPTDFGDVSEVALSYAIDLAKAFRSEIVLVHVYAVPVMGFPDGAMMATAELTARVLEAAQAGLDHQIASHEGHGVTVRGVIKPGDAYSTINETADEVGAELIVMGT